MICVCVCIYIYIYIYIYILSASAPRGWAVTHQKSLVFLIVNVCSTLYNWYRHANNIILWKNEFPKVKFHWNKSEVPLEHATENPLEDSSEIHWTSGNPLEHTTDKGKSVGKTTNIPLERATENPRLFLRCWFLVCTLLPSRRPLQPCRHHRDRGDEAQRHAERRHPALHLLPGRAWVI